MLASLRNLLLITVWISVFGMVLFLGCFFRAYHAFTIEEPVAEVFTQSLDGALNSKMSLPRYLFIRGDQWMVEGDFLKWNMKTICFGDIFIHMGLNCLLLALFMGMQCFILRERTNCI